MKSLTTIKYDVKQLCAEILKVSVQTFGVHKERYMKELEKEYYVSIEIGARNKKYYILEPKQSETAILKDAVSNTSFKKNDLKKIESILKVVLIDHVLPMPEEIAAHVEFSESTVKRIIKKMWEADILMEPETETIEKVNKYTGEIYTHTKKKCSWIYYDKLPGGRTIVEFPNIHNVYGELFSEKLNELYHQHKDNYNHKTACKVAGFHAWSEINRIFDLQGGNRTERWIVATEYRKRIKEKHRCI